MDIKNFTQVGETVVSEDKSLTTVQGKLGIMNVEISYGYGIRGPVAFLEWKQTHDDGLLASLSHNPRRIMETANRIVDAVSIVTSRAIDRAADLTGLSLAQIRGEEDAVLSPAFKGKNVEVMRVKVPRAAIFFVADHGKNLSAGSDDAMIDVENFFGPGWYGESLTDAERWLSEEICYFVNTARDKGSRYVWMYAE